MRQAKKAVPQPERREIAATRELEPNELDAVAGGFMAGCTIDEPTVSEPDPLVQAFLNGFYSTCGCT